MQLQVPFPIIRDLKCRHCTFFVSCGPVFVVPDGGILCGRCNMIAKPQFRNSVYEILANRFLFPCHNWSMYCNKQLEWNEAVVHEQACSYRSTCQLFCNHPAFLCKPERKISIHDDFQLQHIPDQMLIHLQCYICRCYLSCDPVYISEDGKNICHRCINNNGIPQGVLRNLAYEKLASVTIFPCIYKNRGCTMRLPYGKELWRHEGECSYGQINDVIRSNNNDNGNIITKNSRQKKPHVSGVKERGVIMTHSGHIYGTITPHSALWTPPQPEKQDINAEVNRQISAVVKKHAKYDDGRASPESLAEQTYDSMTSTVNNSRKSSISDVSRKNIGEVTPRRVNSPENKFFSRDDPMVHSYGKVGQNNFPRFSIPHSNGHKEEMARPSLPGNMSHYKNNLNYHNTHHVHNEAEELYDNLEHNISNHVPRPIVSEFIQPKRADSFKIGNPKVIGELRMRQMKRNMSQESDGDSVRSGDTLDSLGNSEVFVESQKQ